MKNAVLYLTLAIAVPVRAGAFTPFKENRILPSDRTLLFSRLAAAPLQTLRVQIFPHISKYTTPEGRDSVVDRVTFFSKGACRLEPVNASAKVTQEKAGQAFTVSLASHDLPASIHCDAPVTLRRGPGLRAITYPGWFYVRSAGDQKRTPFLQVINEVNFEDYIKGVVPAEMPAEWRPEALKAQAVAARTYAAFEVMAARLDDPAASFDIDDTIFFQAYLGLDEETAGSNAAADATSGEVLTYRGEVLKAYFSDDSGGYTEDALDAFNQDLPYCLAKKEVYDPSYVRSDWTVHSSLSDIENSLKAKGFMASDLKLAGVRTVAAELSQSGRVKVVHLSFTDGSSGEVDGDDFSYAMELRSRLFHFAATSAGIDLVGKGFGHGVGMAQEGAEILAHYLGWDYARILSFYYDGSVISKVGY